MTAQELIAELSNLPPDTELYTLDDEYDVHCPLAGIQPGEIRRGMSPFRQQRATLPTFICYEA